MASQNTERAVADERRLGAAAGDFNDNSDADLDSLNEQAKRCRRLAEATYNREVCQMLDTMAEGYERSAAQLSKK